VVTFLRVPHATQAQNTPQSETELNLSAFEPIDLPDPNARRSADGRPGPAYWQQEADYQIDVTLDTSANRLSGRQTITYTNNAPQSLGQLWVQLEQNFFRPDSRGARIVPDDARFSGFFDGAGYDLESIELERDGETVSPDTTVTGTRLRIDLDEPLAADGGTVQIRIDWAFTIPEFGADRHGILDVEDGTVYQLAQWYPRMYVYDDVHGWNSLPYLGQGEYYLEYGTFDVNIAVPRNMIVAATGRLQNPEEVLTETVRKRLDEARDSRETVMIVEEEEVGTDAVRPDGEGPVTWRYTADNVRDFAWAASDAFLWDAATADAGDHSVLAQSFYPKEGLGTDQEPGWERSTRYVQHSVEFYSDFVSPYPYPTAINVGGVVGGMEYPQIVFCDIESRSQGLLQVTDHEVGHTWFPMVVGSDERRWVWMDEGLNTFMNSYSLIDFLGQGQVPSQNALQRLSGITMKTLSSTDVTTPIMTYADRIGSDELGFVAYLKPATGLSILREYVIGSDRFDEAFQTYVDRWAYKHPKPADFFRTIENVTGEELDWFWRSWFYETDTSDPAVADVVPGDTTAVTLAHRADLLLPITVELSYDDGSTQRRRVPTEAFYRRDTHTLDVPGGPLQEVVVDPGRLLPDVDRNNNTWTPADTVQSSSNGQP